MARSITQVELWKGLAWPAQYNARKLASLCQISLRTLQRQFQNTLGRSPQHWLLELRIRTAQRLLLQGASIKEIASDLGFKHSSHFCRQFKRLAGMTPSQFVNAARTKFTNPPPDFCI